MLREERTIKNLHIMLAWVVITIVTTLMTRADIEVRVIPVSLDQCFEYLSAHVSADTIAALYQSDEREISRFDKTIGRWMRNEWMMWEGSAITKYFHSLGVDRVEDMSEIVLTSYWRHLNDRQIQLDQQIAASKQRQFQFQRQKVSADRTESLYKIFAVLAMIVLGALGYYAYRLF